jgi:hypothetical protein
VHHEGFWRFKSTLLNDRSLIDFMTADIQYYSPLAIEGENVLDLWDEMEQEIRFASREV